MSLLKITDLDLSRKYVLIREDFNVPMQEGKITSFARIDAALPGIKIALNAGAKLIICSHLGRPKEGVFNSEFSLAPIAEYLSKELNKEVNLIRNWHNNKIELADGELVLLENIRFYKGEKTNNEDLGKSMASLCDIFVMDAFAVAHRAHASTYAVAKHAKIACAGPLLIKEIKALNQALAMPKKPMVALVGGSKVSTKLAVLKSLIKICDKLIPAGGIANTFLAAAGYKVGKSLIEEAQIPIAKQILGQCKVILPKDVICATEISATATTRICNVDDVATDEMILDIGPKTAEEVGQILHNSNTILWNGPVGVFEFKPFASGTKSIAKAIATSDAFSIAGGGDTLAAIEKYQVENDISYISTAGGAFLEFVEGKELPAIKILSTHNIYNQ